MRKIITALILVLALCSCGKVTQTWVWKGEKEIPAKGGTAVWTPNLDDPYVYPDFTAICTKIELVSEDRVIESHIFEKPGKKLQGEWYKITGELNKISITFEPNTTPYIRSIAIYLDNPTGGYGFRVTQAAQ